MKCSQHDRSEPRHAVLAGLLPLSVQISNLGSLRKLDVLDLHSNSIQGMEGLDSLQDLRVLNLAGNHIRLYIFHGTNVHVGPCASSAGIETR